MPHGIQYTSPSSFIHEFGGLTRS